MLWIDWVLGIKSAKKLGEFEAANKTSDEQVRMEKKNISVTDYTTNIL